MKPTLPWLRQTFNEYNTKYFGGRLAYPKFSLNCPGDNWGYYMPHLTYSRVTRKAFVESPGIIYLNGRYSRDERDWIGTLLHEMIHMYINTVLLKYPLNPHGDEFNRLSETINKDGWNISVYNEMKSTDREVEGDEADDRKHEDRVIKPHVFCILEQPQDEKFKVWGFRVEYNSLNQYISTAKRLKQYGATALNVYYCYSSNLNKLPSSATNLEGIGASNYNELLLKISRVIGERLTTENFNIVKTITL